MPPYARCSLASDIPKEGIAPENPRILLLGQLLREMLSMQTYIVEDEQDFALLTCSSRQRSVELMASPQQRSSPRQTAASRGAEE